MPEVWHMAAFTNSPRGGNPAGVVISKDELPFCDMRSVAAQLGYSATAFLVDDSSGIYRARYFSPVTELSPSSCGHATFAAAVAVGRHRESLSNVRIATNSGTVSVQIQSTHDGIAASLTSPSTRSRAVPAYVLREALGCFGWDEHMLDEDLRPVEAYGGTLHLILALRSREAFRSMRFDVHRLRELMWNRTWSTVNVVWRQDPSTYHARNVLLIGGVVEDPATPTAAAALGGYLRDQGISGSDGPITIRQGEFVERPSTIHVEAPAGERAVKVRGGVATISRMGREAGQLVSVRLPA